MKIACLTFNPIQENTYVVWDDTKECAVIDAGYCQFTDVDTVRIVA